MCSSQYYSTSPCASILGAALLVVSINALAAPERHSDRHGHGEYYIPIKNQSIAASQSQAQSHSESSAYSSVRTRQSNENSSQSGAMGNQTFVGGETNHSELKVIPSIGVPTTASTIAAGQQVVSQSDCGPLQSIRVSTVNGTVVGYLSDTEVKQGLTYDLDFFRDGGTIKYYDRMAITDDFNRMIGYKLIGHQVIIQHAIIGTSAARQSAIGGGGERAWGQGSAGSTSSMQQAISRIQLKLCEMPEVRFADKHASVHRMEPASVSPGTSNKTKTRRSRHRCHRTCRV